MNLKEIKNKFSDNDDLFPFEKLDTQLNNNLFIYDNNYYNIDNCDLLDYLKNHKKVIELNTIKIQRFIKKYFNSIKNYKSNDSNTKDIINKENKSIQTDITSEIFDEKLKFINKFIQEYKNKFDCHDFFN